MAETPSRDRRGLGRGLAALLGDVEPGAAAGAPAGTLAEIPVDAIAPNPDQPRAVIEPEALEALAASIRASGILQPVVVAPADPSGRHELIAGERRWRAAREAGVAHVFLASSASVYGNAPFARKDYKAAIASQRQLLLAYPDSPKVPDALLNVASAQSELGDNAAARRTLEELIGKFPQSDAATKAKQRLGQR